MVRGDSQPGAVSGQSSRPSAPSYSGGRPSSSNSSRSYQPPQRTYNNTQSYGNRSYSQPRSYNPPSNQSYSSPRTYSAPSRSYPAPSHSYSAPAPSRSNGGGVAAIGAAVAAEAHTPVGSPPLTAGTNLFANSSARLDLPGGLLLIEVGALRVFLPQQLGFQKSLGSALSF